MIDNMGENLTKKIANALFPYMMYIKTRAKWNMEIKEDKKKYKVILFSHGFYGIPENYRAYINELVSQGNVVVAPYHTDGSAMHVALEEETIPFKPIEKEQYKERTTERIQNLEDAAYIFENYPEFKKHIDLSRIVAIGHSYGGGTVAGQLMNTELKGNDEDTPRLVGGIVMDSWMEPLKDIKKKYNAPLLSLHSSIWKWEGNETARADVDELNAYETQSMTLPETGHHNFNDFSFIQPFFFWLSKGIGKANVARTMERQFTAIHQFLKNLQ
eukprot:CAMPEP_0117420104 /NCGR_PEP_ID=MMETSP0758-20121206/1514_1 /TAXON_ID=63605 /ORGANISM="Percolomonas cosmopolitus, Strain AE-1 (ATCC 50343)" /LENGTH=271 /DNA_ID=CAMNT_0005201531 /DNA_START=502 /DNA_END=1317 /DNA_ORIENTATION=+